jgi:hypothetical protein
MPCCFDGRHVFRQVAPGQDAAVHFRVQGLDAAVEHFRETGVIADLGHGQPGFAQHFGGAAGGQKLDALSRKALGEFEDAPFVGDGDQRLLDGHFRIEWLGFRIECLGSRGFASS